MFELFKTIFPRKTGNWREARKSWDKAITEGTTPDEIMEGLKADIANWIAEEVGPGFIPMATTYLNQHRWEGGLSINITALSKKNFADYTAAEWRFCQAGGKEVTEYMKQFMPAHIKKEFGFGLEIVRK
jgi:hypothetical protein